MHIGFKTYFMALGLLVASVTSLPVHAAQKGWETVRTSQADAKTVVRETELEVKTASGVIIVNANHPVQIGIFTILGRLVNSETLPPDGHSCNSRPTVSI